jgi:hypothetical protein
LGGGLGNAGIKGTAGIGAREGFVGVTVAVVEAWAGCIELGVVGEVEVPNSDR